MSRAEVEARTREGSGVRKAAGAANPANRLVPYLDLFSRLSDEELSRLARAPRAAVEGLRQQVEEVNRALGRYQDLLPRLSDDELARLTGATTKTIRFWRLSQPRHLQGESRRRNPDLTPTPQPLPDSESGASQTAGALHIAISASASMSSLAGSSAGSSSGDLAMNSGEMPVRAIEDSNEFDPSASQSSTLVIDTYE
ncbi:MAG: hypothetical protein KC457_25930 [Myxococcales bacterium]|nr:hypothetical protein [Myxococcales bacterium]